MKTPGQLLLVVSCLGLAACSTVTPSTDFDRRTTFENYKTYAWAPEPKTQTALGAKLDEELHGAVDRELATKGLKKIEGQRPDVYIIYHLTAAQKGDVKHYTDWALPQGGGYYAGWAVTTQTDAVIDHAKPGALVLDFVDARRRQLVWRSVAPQIVERPKMDDPQRVNGAVKAMLAGFPPKK